MSIDIDCYSILHFTKLICTKRWNHFDESWVVICFLPHPQHEEVPRPGTELRSQQ